MFKKLVAIEPVNLIPSAEEALHRYAREVVLFGDVPKDDAEIIRRIGDADAVLLLPHRPGRHRCLPGHPLYRHVLQPLFRGERQCGYRLRPPEEHPRAGHPRLR